MSLHGFFSFFFPLHFPGVRSKDKQLCKVRRYLLVRSGWTKRTIPTTRPITTTERNRVLKSSFSGGTKSSNITAVAYISTVRILIAFSSTKRSGLLGFIPKPPLSSLVPNLKCTNIIYHKIDKKSSAMGYISGSFWFYLWQHLLGYPYSFYLLDRGTLLVVSTIALSRDLCSF